MKEKFITFEGIEGSGKTTQIRLLKDALVLKGHEVLMTREPGGTPLGDAIRQIVLHPQYIGMDPRSELLLYGAARAQHVSQVIEPALVAGKIVLCDRYTDATSAYQGNGRGFPHEWIEWINRVTAYQHKPFLTILLDCPVEKGLSRARLRMAGEDGMMAEDRFERESLAFHEKIRQGYLQLAAKEPKRFVVLNATQSPEKLHHQIVQIVFERLGLV